MTFDEILTQVREQLERDGRVAYRILKRRFELSDEDIEDLKADLIDAKRVAADEDGKVLVWVGAAPVLSSKNEDRNPAIGSAPPLSQDSALRTQHSAAERRQLTVMFCDLVDSTVLSTLLDPEELRDVVHAYHEMCAGVISRYGGHTAQHLGDGLLVYFGYPAAHEDDAQRAVRTGLEILAGLQSLNAGLPSAIKARLPHPIQLRIGIHTGLVVVGEIGGGEKREHLALGETPNIAARIQGLADPNTVMISAATHRLIEGQFECQPFGSHLVKGLTTPIAVYHVQSERQYVSPLAGKVTLTPLVGREQEVGLLLDRWEQVKEGRGHVVLLSGEPGIGKSRLAYTLREHVTREGSLLFEARCSPYYQHSALYPLIDVLQRTLLLTRQDTDEEKIAKLERALALYGMQETVPLFTTLLSLPMPSQYPPLNLTPQKQKERTLQALLHLLMAQAERQATVFVWEDVHWADPSSLEFLTVLIEQLPTTELLLVLTFRPEFTPPWKPHSHISYLVLNRLGKKQVEAMIEQAAAGSPLSPEVIEQIRIKTDGVPLFVEELTKAVMETMREQATGIGEQEGKIVGAQSVLSSFQLGVPFTLQDALMARLDRLGPAKEIAQLGATLGRKFSYELVHAVSLLDEETLQHELKQLVETELVYQRGLASQATYLFKHALIQDTAYQSLLKSTRQQYHQQIARALEERFPQTKENQLESLAHHCTEAGLIEQAILYWQQAGEKALERSANSEAISHLTRGIALVQLLPDTPQRAQQELTLQVSPGSALMAARGHASAEVEHTYTRARELCLQVDETPQLARILSGLWVFYHMRAELETACQLGEQFLVLAERVQDQILLTEAHKALGASLAFQGKMAEGRRHLEQAVTLSQIQPGRPLALFYEDPGVGSLSHLARVLWVLGYPEQAKQRSAKAITLVRGLNHSGSLAIALEFAGWVHQFCRDEQMVKELADATISLATEHELLLHLAWGTALRSQAVAEQGEITKGSADMQASWETLRNVGTRLNLSYGYWVLADACQKAGQVEEGFAQLTKAFDIMDESGGRWRESELYRLKGELLLAQEGQLRD